MIIFFVQFYRVGINNITNYNELDNELKKSYKFSTIDGVNLNLLMERLYPEDAVKEPDEIWNWETLFTQVASELNNETQTKIE